MGGGRDGGAGEGGLGRWGVGEWGMLSECEKDAGVTTSICTGLSVENKCKARQIKYENKSSTLLVHSPFYFRYHCKFSSTKVENRPPSKREKDQSHGLLRSIFSRSHCASAFRRRRDPCRMVTMPLLKQAQFLLHFSRNRTALLYPLPTHTHPQA